MHNHTKIQKDNQPIREHIGPIDQPIQGGARPNIQIPSGTPFGGKHSFISQHVAWAVKHYASWKIMPTKQKITTGLGMIALLVAIILLVRYFMTMSASVQKKHIHYEFF